MPRRPGKLPGMRVGPFTRDLLEALHPLLTVSSGRPVALDAERERFEREAPAHWLVAWDADRPIGFVRDQPEPRSLGEARGEAHAVHGPDRLRVLHELLVAFVEGRPPSPLRFVVAADDPFGDLLGELGFAGERHLACELRLGAIPGSVGVRVAEPRDADAVQRLFGASSRLLDGDLLLVTVGGIRGALRLEVDGEDDEAAAVAMLVVEADARRQGIAQRLLRAASEHASVRGCQRLTAGVPEGNAAARALFEGFGFQRRPSADLSWLALR
jgi:ribosomal protein S18 acetylase RimI-like enzyme